jgi:hypothetical protein
VRDGYDAYDISTAIPIDSEIWTDSRVHALAYLPGDKVLVRAEVSLPAKDRPLENFVDWSEYWFIFQRGSDTPQVVAPLHQKGTTPFFSVVADEPGYIYLQSLSFTSQDPLDAVKIYRVPVDSVVQVVSVRASGASLLSLPSVELVATLSQQQLSGGDGVAPGSFAALDSYISVKNYVPGDTGKILISFVEHVPEDAWTSYVSRIEANGTLTRSTVIDSDIDAVVIDPAHGIFFAERYGSRFLSASHVAFRTGLVTPLPDDHFFQIEASNGVPDGVTFVVGTASGDILGTFSHGEDQWLIGGRGNDTLRAGLVDDLLAGGEGFDTAVYVGTRNQYTLVLDADQKSLKVYDLTVPGISNPIVRFDRLVEIEAIQFSDQTLLLSAPPVYILGSGTETLRGSADVSALIANQRVTGLQTVPVLTIDGLSARYRIGIPVHLTNDLLGGYNLHASTIGAGLVGVFEDSQTSQESEVAGAGSIVVRNGAQLENVGSRAYDPGAMGLPVSNATYAVTAFGWGEGSYGSLLVSSGGKIFNHGQLSYFAVGREGAEGTARIEGVGSKIGSSGHQSEVQVGRESGIGSLSVGMGAEVTIDSRYDNAVSGAHAFSAARVMVGRDGGEGTLTVEDAGSRLALTGYIAQLEVGFVRDVLERSR